MKFLGSFYNPEYAGEGFGFDESDTGTVILHFFSYLKGLQFWLIGVGSRSGNVALVDCWMPISGDLGDKAALKDVEEIPWGQITLTDMTDGKINVLFSPLSGAPWIYTVESAHKLTAPPIVVPPPVEPPPVEPPPVVEPPVEPTTKVLLEVWLDLGAKSKWVDMGFPLNSSKDVWKSRIGGGQYEWTKNRITVLKGDLTITSISTGGPNNPKLTGISKRVYHEGEEILLSMFVGPLTKPDTTGWDQSNYNIAAAELGKFFNASAQVMYGL